jgi:hypothetical protein
VLAGFIDWRSKQLLVHWCGDSSNEAAVVLYAPQ